MVQRGRRYQLAFHKGMEDGDPVHLHRHNFEIVSIDRKPTAGIIKDTEVDFAADNSGPSPLHCHMQQHMDYGLKTIVKYA